MENRIPDIHSLYEWSNWLTPTIGGRRYDTMFYMCFLEGIPHHKEDEQEMVSSSWDSPRDILSAACEGRLLLQPPQVYEAVRMVRWGEDMIYDFLSVMIFQNRLT